MAFDAGMVGAVAYELNDKIAGARIEKVYQPEKDELVLALHTREGSLRVDICAGANNPRINITKFQKENPPTPFMFCTLARKHLTGARVNSVRQIDFERVVEISVESRDEMGFFETKYIYAEIMGKYSNIILTDAEKKIIGVLRPVDFTTSVKRQVLGGMKYELPPKQDKLSPLEATEESFLSLAAENPDMATDKFILANYLGISSLIAREIAYRSCSRLGISDRLVYKAFDDIFDKIKQNEYSPTIIFEDNKPIEYAFTDIMQYGEAASKEARKTHSEVIEEYFQSRDNSEHSRQRAFDLFKLVTNSRARIAKKLALQEGELAECAKKEEYKRAGDLITANIYLLKRGDTKARVIDYYDENMPEVEIVLDSRLSPSQNAQSYYKKYNKAKNAERELTKQIEAAKEELVYIDSVADSLERAVGQSELDEIRRELLEAGYASKIKKRDNSKASKNIKVKPREAYTSGGYKLLCGKNNIQNDYITTKLA